MGEMRGARRNGGMVTRRGEMIQDTGEKTKTFAKTAEPKAAEYEP